MVTSAQLRAARAYLGWTMQQAGEAAGLHRRTVIRLERDSEYAIRQPGSLNRLVAAYAAQRISFKRNGFAVVLAPGKVSLAAAAGS